MKCPYCNSNDDMVIDSRPLDNATVIRRRRECLDCNKRYTTYERVEAVTITVIKKDGSKENFEKNKIRQGLLTSCRKRPISLQDIENIINNVEHELQESEQEISTTFIGAAILKVCIRDEPFIRLGNHSTNGRGEGGDLIFCRMIHISEGGRDGGC